MKVRVLTVASLLWQALSHTAESTSPDLFLDLLPSGDLYFVFAMRSTYSLSMSAVSNVSAATIDSATNKERAIPEFRVVINVRGNQVAGKRLSRLKYYNLL